MYILIAIFIMAVITCLIRAFPFLVLKGKETPSWLVYLGKVLPEASIGMLVVYCLKDTQLLEMGSVLPTLLACISVVLIQVYSRKTVFSVLGGTVVYMVCLHLF